MAGFTVKDIQPDLESRIAIWPCPHIIFWPATVVHVVLIGTHTVRAQMSEHLVQILTDMFLPLGRRSRDFATLELSAGVQLWGMYKPKKSETLAAIFVT